MLKLNNKKIVSARLNSTNISLMKINGNNVFGNNLITEPELFLGDISQIGEIIESSNKLITGFIDVQNHKTLSFENNVGHTNKTFIYDENKNFIKDWFVEDGQAYSYKYLPNNEVYTYPVDFKYIVIRLYFTDNAKLKINYL